MVAVSIGATAIGLAVFGFVANASYVASFGQPGLSAVMLAGLGVAIEVLALGLPTLARLFAHGGDRRGARVAWVGWLPAVAMALISSCGFSSRHISDSVFARHQVVDRAEGRRAELVYLKAQRVAITELKTAAGARHLIGKFKPLILGEIQTAGNKLRPVGPIDAAISRAQAAAAAVWTRSTREARAEAVRRDKLDAEIREAETTPAAMPAVATADLGASVAADMVVWLTHGAFAPGAHDFQILRIVILTLMPACAGPLLGLAMRLWRAR